MARAIHACFVVITICDACAAQRGQKAEVAPTAAVVQTCRVAKVIARGAPIHGANGLELDKDGHLLVASLLGNEIVTMDRDTGAIITRLDLAKLAAPPSPDDLAVGADGSLYYTSFGTGYVSRLSSNHTLMASTFVAPGTNSITFSSDGRLFVGLDFIGDGLYELDADLAHAKAIIANQPGKHPLGFLDGVDFGPDGRLYGPLWARGMVVSIDVRSCRDALSPWTQCDIRVVARDLNVPSAVKLDSKGRLYVTSWADGRVLRVSDLAHPSTPELVAQLTPGLDNLLLDGGDRLYVSNGSDGSISRVASGVVETLSPGGMVMPGGIAVTETGALYVVDFQALRQLSPASGELLGIDRNVFMVSALGNPTSVSADGENLVLTSYLGNLVQVWNPATHAVIESHTMSAQPFDAVRFQRELAVSIRDGHRGRVVRLGTGETLLGGERVVYPLGLAASGDALFVSDWATGLVWKVGATSPSVVASGLARPEGLALDRRGGLLVVESGKGRLSRIDLATGHVTTIVEHLAIGLLGAEPTTAPHLTLNGVAVAPSGQVFVTGDKDDVVYRVEPSRCD